MPSVANGGPTGLIFGLIVAVFYYSFIGLSLAEVRAHKPRIFADPLISRRAGRERLTCKFSLPLRCLQPVVYTIGLL